jgi:D-ribose pyranase
LKKSGILNPDLAYALAQLGHTDLICIADAGLPIPDSVPRVDLTLVLGVPTIAQVLAALADECVFQKKTYAKEADQKNTDFVSQMEKLWPELPTQKISHEDFKELVSKCRLVIRTGESSPYANAILESGVPF